MRGLSTTVGILDYFRRGQLQPNGVLLPQATSPTAVVVKLVTAPRRSRSAGTDAAPAKASGLAMVDALKRGRCANADFGWRGDTSGTRAAELRYWKGAGVAPPAFAGYKACGCGMGPALNMAASTGAYVLADRGTWLSFRNRGEHER